MKKNVKTSLFFFLCLALTILVFPYQAKAKSCIDEFGARFVGGEPPTEIQINSLDQVLMTITGDTFIDGDIYQLLFRNRFSPISIGSATVQAGKLVFAVTNDSVLKEKGQKTFQLVSPGGTTCELWQWQVVESFVCDSPTFSQAGVTDASCLDVVSGSIDVQVSGLKNGPDLYTGDDVIIDIFKGRTRTENAVEGGTVSANNGVASFQFDPTNFQSGNYNVQVRKSGSFSVACSSAPSLKAEKCSDQSRTDDTLLDNEPYDICKQIPDQELQDQCLVCTASGEGGDAGQGGVWTAIGCISRDPIKITERLIQVGLGMGGGVALIMTLAGGFILSTSQGDPQKANQAKEMITNSVIGLLFVIFSVFILQFIGVKILNIPGFGGS